MCKHYQSFIAEDDNFKTFFNTINGFSLKTIDKNLGEVIHEIPIAYCPICGADTGIEDKEVHSVTIKLDKHDWGICQCGWHIHLIDSYCPHCGKKLRFDW